MNEREKMQHAELDRIKRMLVENPEKLGPDGKHRRAIQEWLRGEVQRAEKFEAKREKRGDRKRARKIARSVLFSEAMLEALQR